MKHNTWLKFYHRFLDWEWYDDINTKVLFIHLLLKANYKDNKWKGITIKRGQHLTGRFSLAKETGLSEQSVRTSLGRLISTNEITKHSTHTYTIITINNYDKYQVSNQQDNQVLTKCQPSANHSIREIDKIDNTYAHSFKTFWKQYPRKESKKRAETIYKRKATSKKKETKILEGLKRFNVKWKAEETEKRYIPIPTSWLNAERWEDEIEISNVNKRPKL